MKNSPIQRIYPYKRNGRYYNHVNENPEGFLLKTLPTFLYSMLSGKRRMPKADASWDSHRSVSTPSDSITWIGHSSFLINIAGKNILTDPIFGDLTWLYPRLMSPGINLDYLPQIDVVLISHNHRDHMDKATLIGLKAKFPELKVLVPQGDKAWFIRHGFSNSSVNEYTWWEQQGYATWSKNVNSTLLFTFLPAVHWSQRGIFDKNKSLWGSWLIQGEGITIYFAGDTAYSNHFSIIGQEGFDIDIALMPIAPCEPRQWLKQSHIGPEEAVRAFMDLNAKQFVPMHWGTFAFGIDSFELPINLLKHWWHQNQQALQHKQLHIVPCGMPIDLSYGLEVQQKELIRENF